MTLPERITLTGFSGTGKSSVAGLLAAELGWQAVDSDDLVTALAGKSVPDIFGEDGEKAFRDFEAEAFAGLAGRSRLVVAAGGGATLLQETRRAIAKAGLVVCLEALPSTLTARLATASQDEERPLLRGGDAAARLTRLKAQRAALYSLADFTIHTDTLTPQDVATEIARWYRQFGGASFAGASRLDALTVQPAGLAPVLDAPGATTVVRAASAEYPAYVGWGELEKLGEHTKRATGSARAFLITDENVGRLWGEAAVSSLRSAGVEVSSLHLPPGDASKDMATAGRVYDWLAGERAERGSVIVGLGGGMVTDLAGYIAATYMRGLPLVQAPTSLLGMVDAAIGGKTAINHSGAKNIVGAFYQPRVVVADAATLTTLPRRELVEGLGEVVKHAFIRDPELLELLEDRLDDVLALDKELITDVVARNIRIKAEIVSADERETGGVRELLNFGHTLGHAFEAAADYSGLLHGEAVSVGMLAAAEIGAAVNRTPPAVVERLRALVRKAGMIERPPAGLDGERVRTALALDKKVVAGGQRWILLEDVGRAVVTKDVPGEVVSRVLNSYLAS